MQKKLTLLTPRNIFLAIVAILGVAALVLIYAGNTSWTPIRSDGLGYYLYLPATFLYRDLSLQSIVADHFGGTNPAWHGAYLWGETGRYLNKYPAGVAVMTLPFFLIAILVSWIGGGDLTGFSTIFQYSAAVSGLFYGTAGLGILYQVLKEHFEDRTILPVLAGIVFGTSLFNFITFDATFSHAYSFFLISCFLYLLPKLNEAGKGRFVVLGIVAGLIIITRPSNVLIFIVGLLYNLSSHEDIHSWVKFWRERITHLLLAGAAFFAICSIQMAYWKIITGSFVVYSYGDERFNFLRPAVGKVLFSLTGGLFFWTPLVIAAIPGLFVIRKRIPEYFAAFMVFFPLNLWVISSWYMWDYGGGFGHRVFVDTLPLVAVSLSALYESTKAKVWHSILTGYIILCSVFTTWLMINYWLLYLPDSPLLWKLFGWAFVFK